MPPKAWTGAISFGLVSVPIAVLGATEDHSVRFRRIHTLDNGLVRNRYWCEIEDREVSYGEIGQGYETAGGRIIPLTDEELRQLPLPTVHAIKLVGFLPALDVDPVRIGPGYHLQPQGSVAAKPYVLWPGEIRDPAAVVPPPVQLARRSPLPWARAMSSRKP
ncbi:Ku protein [Streptomyces sp. NPDC056821]|uniref:Ku protein n=1 Tax=unclassified Streptomyces TaxID=2593676 RepID=UPI0036A079C4